MKPFSVLAALALALTLGGSSVAVAPQASAATSGSTTVTKQISEDSPASQSKSPGYIVNLNIYKAGSPLIVPAGELTITVKLPGEIRSGWAFPEVDPGWRLDHMAGSGEASITNTKAVKIDDRLGLYAVIEFAGSFTKGVASFSVNRGGLEIVNDSAPWVNPPSDAAVADGRPS